MSIADSDLALMSELTLSIEGASFDGEIEFDDCLHHRESECSTVLDDNETVAHFYGELKKYLELLPHTMGSLNALLDAEHNATDEKAMSLLQYYEERPNLLDYTLEKELPRMEYTWIDEKTGEFITEKSRIAILLWEASLSEDPAKAILPRCANQSMLADLLQFLTSTESGNSLIRTQFHMAVDTRKVNITIMPSNKTVLVKSTLGLSLPHPVRGLVPIGTVDVSAQFSPVVPFFHYHVESVQVVQPCPDDDELLEMAIFLQDLPSFLIEEEEALGSNRPSNRDVFLQKTQTAWKHSSGLARNLLHKMSSGPSRADHGDEEPSEELQEQIPRNAPLQKSLRRIREAQRASSKKIMKHLKSAAPPSVFKRPTQPQQESAAAAEQPQPKNTWGQVSSRLLNKNKQSKSLPPQQQPEKWSGMLRNRLGRMANSLATPSSQENGVESMVFDDNSHDEDSPTEPPSDDEERTTFGLFGSSKTFSTTNSPTAACDHSNSSEEEEEVVLDFGAEPEEKHLSFQGPELWDNNTSTNNVEKEVPQNPLFTTWDNSSSSSTDHVMKEVPQSPVFTTRKVSSLTLYEESEPAPTPTPVEGSIAPAVAVETILAPTSLEEATVPDGPAIVAETTAPPMPSNEISVPAMVTEMAPAPTSSKENTVLASPAITAEPVPGPTPSKEQSAPADPAISTGTIAAPILWKEISVPTNYPAISTGRISAPTPAKEPFVPASPAVARPAVAPEMAPASTPSKQSSFRTNPFGSKRWQNSRRFLTKLMK